MQTIMLRASEDSVAHIMWFLESLSSKDVEIIDSFDFVDEPLAKKIDASIEAYKRGERGEFVALEDAKRNV